MERLQSTIIRSVAREYGQGVTKVTGPRRYVKYLSVQNRDNKEIFFWFGLIPLVPTDPSQGFFPDDPTEWTAQQQLDAGAILKTYGFDLSPGLTRTMETATTNQLYAYVETGSAIAHLLIG